MRVRSQLFCEILLIFPPVDFFLSLLTRFFFVRAIPFWFSTKPCACISVLRCDDTVNIVISMLDREDYMAGRVQTSQKPNVQKTERKKMYCDLRIHGRSTCESETELTGSGVMRQTGGTPVNTSKDQNSHCRSGVSIDLRGQLKTKHLYTTLATEGTHWLFPGRLSSSIRHTDCRILSIRLWISL